MTSLGRTQRRILLLAELHQRRQEQAPTWGELGKPLGVPRDELRSRILTIRRGGHVTFTDEPRSLLVTEKGPRAAVNGGRP